MISKIHLRNVKGITDSFELGRFTSLYGKNGTGKSAILDAIKIGLVGYTDLGKQASKSYQFASGKTMEITLESEDGQTITRKFEKSGSGAKQTITLNGEVVKEADLVLPECFNYPVESIHPGEFLSLSGEKRADYIFSSLNDINTIKPEDIEQKIELFKQPEKFDKVLKTLKAKKSELDKEVKRCLANIQKLTGDIGELPAGNLNEWKEKKTAATAELETIVKEIASNEEKSKLAKSRQSQIENFNKNIADSEAHIKDAESKIKECENSINIVTKPGMQSSELLGHKQALENNINILLHRKADLTRKVKTLQDDKCCPYCNTKSDALEQAVFILDSELFEVCEELEEKQAELGAINEDYNKAVVAEKALEENESLQREIKIQKNAIERYQTFKQKNDEDLKALTVGENEVPASLDILNAKAEGLRVQIKEAEDNIKKFVSVQAIRKRKSESEKERIELQDQLDNIKDAIKSTTSLREKRLSSVKGKLLVPFNEIIGSAFNCPAFINLVKNDKQIFDFGLVKDDKEISFETLSGGEKTIALTALVASIQIIKGQIGIGLFELAEADVDSYHNFLKAVRKIGFEQIVIASCHTFPIEPDEDAILIKLKKNIEPIPEPSPEPELKDPGDPTHGVCKKCREISQFHGGEVKPCAQCGGTEFNKFHSNMECIEYLKTLEPVK